eukprot:GHVU01087636.1.p1 GENE.GHVU01087636.1~~GHVU01087636.1.p1  ORF type:complete len:103 (-),score=1.19 GHVU01087636.1:1825-2133(-)
MWRLTQRELASFEEDFRLCDEHFRSSSVAKRGKALHLATVYRHPKVGSSCMGITSIPLGGCSVVRMSPSASPHASSSNLDVRKSYLRKVSSGFFVGGKSSRV